jgi:hypothetical protein
MSRVLTYSFMLLHLILPILCVIGYECLEFVGKQICFLVKSEIIWVTANR